MQDMTECFVNWINKTHPGRFRYHHLRAANDMLEGFKAGWREAVLQCAIEVIKDDIESGRFNEESPEEHMKRLEE